jgi:hypothetical protein
MIKSHLLCQLSYGEKNSVQKYKKSKSKELRAEIKDVPDGWERLILMVEIVGIGADMLYL